MKFAHIGDCHLGSWRQPELRDLNFKSFQLAIDISIREKVEFVLITGDLFDNAYPPIETLKEAFREFRKLKDNQIPVFLIAGSHDYSASGKSFLDVLEKAGFCKNVSIFEEKNGYIYLEPTIHKNIAIYGYPGRKSGLEVEDIERIKIQDSPGLFKILMLHTAIRDALDNLQIKAVDERKLPKVDYLAMSHLHINYCRENRAYSGPIFPNNISELSELQAGSFCIFNNGVIRREIIKLREVITIEKELKNGLTATQEILDSINQDVRNKIVILKLYGALEKGKISDIDFQKIESFLKNSGAYTILKSTSKLHLIEPEFKLEITDSQALESQIIKKFEELNKSKFNQYIPNLLNVLQIEKGDDEKLAVFEERLLSESRKLLSLNT